MNERDTILKQAHLACLREDYVSAYALYEDLLKKYPDDLQVLLDYGRAVYREHVDLEKSARLFQQALEIDPDSIDAMLWLAEVSSSGYGPGYNGAISLYKRVIEIDARCVDAYIGLGLRRQSPSVTMTLEEAIEAFRTAITLDSQRADAHLDLGMSLLDAGDQTAAREEFLIAVNVLNTTGQQKLAKVIQKLIGQIDRKELITNRAYWNFSPRFEWLTRA